MEEKIKKMPAQLANDMKALSDKFDMYATLGFGIIRIRERARTEITPSKAEKTVVRGFEVFGKTDRGFEMSRGQTFMYPSVDGYRYGYIPNTEYNKNKLKNMLGSKNLLLEDKEYIDFAIEEAKKAGLPTEYVPVVNDFGDTLNKQEIAKKHRIEQLEKMLEQQELDKRIAELEAKLALVEPKEEKAEEPKAVKPLAGKSINK